MTILALVVAVLPRAGLALAADAFADTSRQSSGAFLALTAASADAAHESSDAAFLNAVFAQTLPPSFWMYKTTPPPPIPPGPNPQVLWVEQTVPPLPTTPPAYEQCYGCDCLVAFPGELLSGGDLSERYTCFSHGGRVVVPEFKWAGAPVNSGQGHPLNAADGTDCTKSRSFAITMEDMDYPYGVGESANTVRVQFWAVNIPGDWTEFNEHLAHQTYQGDPIVVIGNNDGGVRGLEMPCPEKGVHRYRITLWAVNGYLGSETEPVNPNSRFTQDILPELTSRELSRSTFYGNVKAHGYSPKLFLQQATSSWLR